MTALAGDHIIGAFERYHKAMTDHQGTMAYWTELKDQLDYLNMSTEEKIDYHRLISLKGYLDEYERQYDPDADLDTLLQQLLNVFREDPNLIGTGSLRDYVFYFKGLDIDEDVQQRILMGKLDQDVPLLNDLSLVLFFLGFVPIVGQALDVLDFVTSLARGDVAGAVWNLIPMIGDAVAGFRRIARKGSSLYSAYKASGNIKDITEDINKLKRLAGEIEDQAGALRVLSSEHNSAPVKYVYTVDTANQTTGKVFQDMRQGQHGVYYQSVGEAVEYAIVRVRDVELDSLGFQGMILAQNRGQLIVVKGGATGINFENYRLTDGSYAIDLLIGHSHPTKLLDPDELLDPANARKYYQPSKGVDIPTVEAFNQSSSYIITGERALEVYRFNIDDQTFRIDDIPDRDTIISSLYQS